MKDRDGLFTKVTILTLMPDYRPFHQTASIQTQIYRAKNHISPGDHISPHNLNLL